MTLSESADFKEYCTVCLWEIFNIILYFPVDCLFRVKTVTLETANVTNCHVIATDILFLSSNHRSVQFLYLAASVQILNQLHCLAWSKSVLFPFKMSSLPLCKDDFGGEVTWTVRVIVGWSNGVEFNLRKIVLEVSLCREVKKSNWVRVLFSQVKVLNKLCHKIKFVTQCMGYSLIAYFCFIHSMK